jgi:hypothetical protein
MSRRAIVPGIRERRSLVHCSAARAFGEEHYGTEHASHVERGCPALGFVVEQSFPAPTPAGLEWQTLSTRAGLAPDGWRL